MQEEIFKDVPDYEGLYQVSNLGRVKQLQCDVYKKDGTFFYTKKEKVKVIKMKQKYKFVNLNSKKFYVHQLVAMAFLNHKPCGIKLVVDHIDGNPLNNNINNLQIITQALNTSKGKKRLGTSSKYKGVCYDKQRKKWIAIINNKFIGRYVKEEEAYNAYLNQKEEMFKLNKAKWK